MDNALMEPPLLRGIFFIVMNIHNPDLNKLLNDIETVKRNFEEKFNCRLVSLSKNMFSIVDKEDYEKTLCNKWTAHNPHKDLYYAVSCKYKLHRIIMGIDRGDERVVDHINGNGLDNRRCNLRICTQQENMCNRKSVGTSKYKGVYAYRGHKKVKNPSLSNYGKEYSWMNWVVSMRKKGIKTPPAKYFPYTPDGEIKAAKYYDELAKKYHGEFARLNFYEK